MQLRIYLTKRQREAALMSGIETMSTIVHTDGNYALEWHPNLTDTIVQRIKMRTPDHGNREIPYKSLIVKMILAHRGEK